MIVTVARVCEIVIRKWKSIALRSCLLSLVAFELVVLALANGISLDLGWGWVLVLSLKVLIEVIATAYAAFYIVVASYYLVTAGNRRRSRFKTIHRVATVPSPRIGVVYLCCNDFDREAVESILSASFGRETTLIVHDDSTDPSYSKRIRKDLDELCAKYEMPTRFLTRLDRLGGKPGALNNVLKLCGDQLDYLFVLDSDSYVLDSAYLEKTLNYFDDPRTALVQLKNVGVLKPGDTFVYRILSLSVDAYDVFVHFLARFGWCPFLGHNAMISVPAAREVGGFSPDVFADDIDFSVKLRLNGYRIRYAGEIPFGERHPVSYQALRKRTFKWSYGCAQVLLKWATRIIRCTRISTLEKLGFFFTVNYYNMQILSLTYLTIFYMVLPLSPVEASHWMIFFLPLAVLWLFPFVSSFVFFLKERRVMLWFIVAPLWGLIYGSQDFVLVSSVIECIKGKKRAWEPTNAAMSLAGPPAFQGLLECVFGLSILVVPALFCPLLLVLPPTLLFSSRFVAVPLLLHTFSQFGNRRESQATPGRFWPAIPCDEPRPVPSRGWLRESHKRADR